MGILDRLKSLVATAGSVAPASELRGPLGLEPGDGVGWYRERWAVAGVRRLVSEGQVVWQYCLRDRAKGRVVLAAEEGAETTLWLERPVDAEVRWDQDVIDDVGDEPFKLSSHGRAEVQQVGDTPAPLARAVDFRQFEDASSDQAITLEDWQGKREVRVGEVIHEAELTFVRVAETGGVPDEFWRGDDGVEDADRGPPDSVDALSRRRESDEGSEIPVVDEVGEDQDPTAFDDEEWDDAEECGELVACTGPVVEAVADSEEDEWLVAARHIREHGIPAETKR